MPQDQKIVTDERGQEQPADKKRAQQGSQNIARERGGAYVPTNASEGLDPANKKTGEF